MRASHCDAGREGAQAERSSLCASPDEPGKWGRSGFCPQGVGANLFAKALSRATHLLRMSRPFCGQVRSYGFRPESKADLCITMRAERDKWWRSGFCPQGVGANLFAKALVRATHLLRMSRPFRGQVRSYGFRPESKADLCITMRAERDRWGCSGFCPQGVGANLFAKALVRATHLLRMSRPFRGQVRSYGFRPESKADLCITMRAERDKWGCSGFCPQGVGANLFAKALVRATHLLRMSRPFRGQVRSYGFRPESKADLCITMRAERDKWGCSGFCPQGVGANLFAKALSRATHLLRMSRPFRGQVRSYGFRPESKADFVCNDEG